MQKRHWSVVLGAAIFCAIPLAASAQPQAGVFMWRQDAEMDVDAATDWDGSNDTADERGKDWDFKSSAVGVRGGYTFAQIVTVSGDIGIAQSTARSVDVSDANLDMTSRSLDEGIYVGLGVKASQHFPGSERVFWGASLSAHRFSSEFDEDVTTTWELDETTLAMSGRIGYLLRGIGVYGGLRFVSDDADVEINDLSRAPGLQTRSVSLERASGTDLMVGAEYRGLPVSGLVEVGFVGSFSATTGLAMHY